MVLRRGICRLVFIPVFVLEPCIFGVEFVVDNKVLIAVFAVKGNKDGKLVE
jgi:hypothetical protein